LGINLGIKEGDSISFSKTVGETDVYLFAGITGDFAENHVNEEIMRQSKYKKRIAHGVLSIGYSSTACTRMAERASLPCVSYGYDGIRFIKPIFIGDTITATYTIEKVDEGDLKSYSKVEIKNQDGELCTVGTHILKYIE